jgi:hypothetical protein
LFDKAFDRYFETYSGGDSLWLFVHVPKTAGSSLTAEAEGILTPSFNIDIDHTDTTRTYQAKFDAAVQDFLARHARAPFRFATGHVVSRHVDMIRATVPALRCFTMLRNPMARLVSDYRFQRSAMNLARDHFIANTPSFEAYVSRRHVHNKMALNLVPRPIVESGDVQACVEYMMGAYAFVGLQEMYPLGLRTLTTLMGEPHTPQARVRVNTEPGDDDVALTPEMEQSLRSLNAMDIGLFQAFQSRWRGIRDDLREYLKSLGVPVAKGAVRRVQGSADAPGPDRLQPPR